MILLWFYLGAYTILPIIGEFIVFYFKEKITAGSVDLLLIYNNILFVIIMLLTAFFLSFYKFSLHKRTIVIDICFAKKVFNRSILFLIFIVIVIFILGGYKIVFNIADRGEIRAHLGIYGPIYTLFLSYVPISILVFCSVIYIHLNKVIKKFLFKKLLFLYSFSLILGYISGYKSVALTTMIPGLVILFFRKFNIVYFILFILFSVTILTIFTSIVRHESIQDSFYFMLHRATVMTAYGTIGVWNTFHNSVNLHDAFINFIGIFGQKLSSSLLGLSTSDPEFLKTNLSRLITYKVYPDSIGALENLVNVTVTNFGHAIYILGKQLYILYAFIYGIIIGIIIRMFKVYVIKGYPLRSSILAVYFFSVIIPSINSGGIFMLFSLPVFIYIFLTYILLKCFIKKGVKFA